jgi:two-component system chemotaxis response regulator CheY
MDGIGFIQNVRRDERYKATPILVLTTESDPDIKDRAQRAGATGWIVKPFDPRKLAEAIRKVTA